MTRTPAVALCIAAVLCAALAAQGFRTTADLDFVELDAVVVDGKGRPVHDLTQDDFRVREDGKPVSIQSFTEVRGPHPTDRDEARTVVLLLDDTGVAPVGTQSVQTIARAFVSSASQIDDLPVVRLHVPDDEPFGDRLSGELRIRAYRGGAWPFAFGSTTREVLQRVAGIARFVADNPGKRKVLVCVGSPFICNIQEPPSGTPGDVEQAWASAMRDAARANLATYALIPGRAGLRGGGVPEFTGGEVFASSYDVGPPIDRILQDAANYYVIGYWPVGGGTGLHRIEVKVARRGAHVHARKVR
jgi:hypothetical protein